MVEKMRKYKELGNNALLLKWGKIRIFWKNIHPWAWVIGISSAPSSGGGHTLRCLETDILRHFDRDGVSFSLKEVKMGRSSAECWQTGPRLGPGCGRQTCVCNEYSVSGGEGGALHCGVTGTLEIHISVSDNTRQAPSYPSKGKYRQVCDNVAGAACGAVTPSCAVFRGPRTYSRD